MHGRVKATYTVFTNGGKTYFQIDTYGSSTRKINDKISQSIQVDKETAELLIEILKKTFEI
ncbi:MAG: methionyl-tRNA formyltransferase [Clostridia bacterium]|nr:methionyl-tRNA formyltransferase [Clostridia bacterium]